MGYAPNLTAVTRETIHSGLVVADGITKDAFMQAASVVIAHAAYLPSAQCFALLPVASTLGRTGADTAASLDYNLEQGCVTLTAQKTIR